MNLSCFESTQSEDQIGEERTCVIFILNEIVLSNVVGQQQSALLEEVKESTVNVSQRLKQNLAIFTLEAYCVTALQQITKQNIPS